MDIHASPIKILFHPSGQSAFSDNGAHLLDIARRSRIRIDHTCNAERTCGKCRVIVNGSASPVTDAERHFLSEEQLEEGWRLACQVIPEGDLVVEVPETGPIDILSEGVQARFRLEPAIEKTSLELAPPSLEDQRDDLSRLTSALPGRVETPSDLATLQSISGAMREGEWKVTAVRSGRELIAVEPGDTRSELFGVAFDIGTTTLVAYLRDLNTGRLVAVSASMNPQTEYGADVIARIHHTLDSPQGRVELRKAVVRGMNDLIAEVCETAGISSKSVYDATVAGNTTMLHLFAGLPVESIAQAPFIPAVRRGLSLPALDLWLKINPRGRAYLLPHIASYVGADIAADLLASNLHRRKRLTLLMDFGTNAEIVLGNRERIVACSAAAGPCFEGGNISCGMRASRGAILKAELVGEELILETAGDAPPAGLCGTGLLDVAALLRRHRLISDAGKLLDPAKVPTAPEALRRRIVPGDKGLQFRLADEGESATGDPIHLTQRDLRELQAAKAAIAAGARILCSYWGAEVEDIQEVLLAGAFGNSIRVESGKILGLLPKAPHARYRSIGNAAGAGAQNALLSVRMRRRAEAIASEASYLELSGMPAFTDAYMEEMMLPSLDSLEL